jgi:hypothetical protein
MSEPEDVVRWSVDPEAPDGMRELMRAANSDGEPTAAEVAHLRARIAGQLAAQAPAATLLSVRTLIVGLLVVGVGVVGYLVSRPRGDERMTAIAIPALPAASPPAPIPPALVPVPAAPVPAAPMIAAAPASPPAPKRRVVVPPASPPPVPIAAEPAAPLPTDPPVAPRSPSEVALLEHARAALGRGDAANALALTEQDATLYPDGELVEEREALTIEALIKLGRRDEATARWSNFATSYPHSNYHARLQRLIDAR